MNGSLGKACEVCSFSSQVSPGVLLQHPSELSWICKLKLILLCCISEHANYVWTYRCEAKLKMTRHALGPLASCIIDWTAACTDFSTRRWQADWSSQSGGRHFPPHKISARHGPSHNVTIALRWSLCFFALKYCHFSGGELCTLKECLFQQATIHECRQRCRTNHRCSQRHVNKQSTQKRLMCSIIGN